MAKKLLPWVAIVFVALFVVRDPATAAVTANHLGDRIADVADAFGTFFINLVGGER